MTARVQTARPVLCADPTCGCVEGWLAWRARGEGWLTAPADVVALAWQAVKRADSAACRTFAAAVALDDGGADEGREIVGDVLGSLDTLRELLEALAVDISEHAEAAGEAA